MRPGWSALVGGAVGKGQQRRLLSVFEEHQAAFLLESSDTPAAGPGGRMGEVEDCQSDRFCLRAGVEPRLGGTPAGRDSPMPWPP